MFETLVPIIAIIGLVGVGIIVVGVWYDYHG